MKVSNLKHELDVLKLNQKHEMELLKVKHDNELKMLKHKCTHMYDDKTTAKRCEGPQWDPYYRCEICGVML